MCGIVGLHLRDEALYPQLGVLLERDARRGRRARPRLRGRRGVRRPPPSPGRPRGRLAARRTRRPHRPGRAHRTRSARRRSSPPRSRPRTSRRPRSRPRPARSSSGPGPTSRSTRAPGDPRALAATYDLAGAQGWQGLAHTRMATESAVTAEGCHPFSVGPDQCLVHNGSFANHATIRRELEHEGVRFDSRERLRGRSAVRRCTTRPRATTSRRRCGTSPSASTASTRCW